MSTNKDFDAYLAEFSYKYSADDVLDALNSVKDVKVSLIGDSILDEYTFAQQMDRAGKEALFTYRELESETHAGGVFAVANHLAQFTDNVRLFTIVGTNHNGFINESLDKKVKSNVIVQPESKTLIKKRYIDQYKGHKEFEIYNTEGLEPTEHNEKLLIGNMIESVEDSDMTLVTDFGHGLITPTIRDYLIGSSKYLAVNAQLNGGNMGFNFITNYARANFVSLNERELRLPLQEKRSDIRIPMTNLKNRMRLESMNITLGKNGSMYNRDYSFYHAPGFNQKPVDTIGAGDAVLSITSLLSYKKANPEITAFLGNCVGAAAVNIVGNRKPVEKINLENYIRGTLEHYGE